MNAQYDIAVIGGGASGMAAAISAARKNSSLRICIVEAQPRIGRKLLATGNGRCNISNRRADADCYRSDCRYRVRSAFEIVSPGEVLKFLESIGIALSDEEEGRIYPRSGQAASVLDMLRYELENRSVDIICGFSVKGMSGRKGFFCIKSDEKTLSADRVIFACGAKAAPQLGGNDDGIRLLRSLGHTSSPMRPALVPLRCSAPEMKALKGARIECKASIVYKGKGIYSDFGEVQFADGAISGIVIFQLSSRLARAGGEKAEIVLDLMPETTVDEVQKMLIIRRNSLGYLTLENFLSGIFGKRVGMCLVKSAAQIPLTETAAKLTDEQIDILAKDIKAWSFTVDSPAPWQQAQVMHGGIRLSEFESSLQSKLVPGIYACGELLDVDGDCGGYNLHWAWTSGILAGRSAAENS